MPLVCIQLTGEHGERTHLEICATVAARSMLLSSAQDNMREPHGAGNTGETSADLQRKNDKSGDINKEHDGLQTSTSQNIS